MRKLLYLIPVILFACEPSAKQERENEKTVEPVVLKSEYSVTVDELTDEEYPDNNDIGYRSDSSFKYSHGLNVIYEKDSSVSFDFISKTEGGSNVSLKNINISTFIPGIPEWVKSDEYLSHITMINQEWNRQQVKFTLDNKELVISEEGEEGDSIVRVDLARNCLNSYLWEIAMWRNEGGKSLVYYHGWFSFPSDLYDFLEGKKNHEDFAKYKFACAEWVDPESKPINMNLLRKVDSEKEVTTVDIKDGFYPKKSARLTKYKNIVYPKGATKISDFQTDKAQFSTYSIPGFYNTADPRSTELGRLLNHEKSVYREVTNANTDKTELFEVELVFSDSGNVRGTKIVFGGIEKSKVPTLAVDDMNNGYKMPMGVANHSFYEKYNDAVSSNINNNPYYGFILDKEGNWLDSHKVGIDGPMMHWDAEKENVLHVWLLSFERHAFVGHYILDLN